MMTQLEYATQRAASSNPVAWTTCTDGAPLVSGTVRAQKAWEEQA